jgi:hypothetical protein
MDDSIVLDENGRIHVDGAITYEFKSYEKCFNTSDSTLIEHLKSDCKIIFNAKEIEEGDNYSTGSTYFLPAKQHPRCNLEILVKNIFDHYATDINYDVETSGAEWWSQCIDENDDIGFHWDRDYGIEEDHEINIHPHRGTVTYLTNHGGPTMVLDTSGNFPHHTDVSCSIHKCIVSMPRCGKHISFDGLLLHGASYDILKEIESDGSEKSDTSSSSDDINSHIRITFLVNIWFNHVPTQSEYPSLDIISKLSGYGDRLSPDMDASNTSQSFHRHMNILTFDHKSNHSDITLDHNISESDIQQNIFNININDFDYSILLPLYRHDILNSQIECNSNTDTTVYMFSLSDQWSGQLYIDENESNSDSENDSSDDSAKSESSSEDIPKTKRRKPTNDK